MDGLTASCCSTKFTPRFSGRTRSGSRRPGFLALAASGDDPKKLDKWDQMELKFGRLIGEDPKLTLAKIMGRKSNPDVSYLDIEKSFTNKKGKSNTEIEDIPLDWSKEESEASNSMNDLHFSNEEMQGGKNLNLTRPVMRKGTKAEAASDVPVFTDMKPSQPPQKINTKGNSTSNIPLRKPSTLQADDTEPEKSSKLEIKPNIYLKMRKSPQRSSGDTELLKKPVDLNGNFSDVTLLKKPEPTQISSTPSQENLSSSDSVGSSSNGANTVLGDVELLQMSAMSSDKLELTEEVKASQFNLGLQQKEHDDAGTPDREAATTQHVTEASLQGKPQRLDPSIKQWSDPEGAEKIDLNDESHNDVDEIKHFQSTALGEHEENDWARAESHLQTGDREEVELISCNSRGFVVQFGSLVGFLPYRNLVAKWKYLAFESWLRKKGLDPLLYKQNLSITGSYEVQNRNIALDSSPSPETTRKLEENKAAEMKLEDLLNTYDQEKTRFLSLFVGQKMKVSVILADKNSRKLMFSARPKEREELVQKKRNLMAKLSIGDVVKCCIKKITYFGIFVEVEGVPALIHQSEVSWDAALDPSSYYKIGQIVEAKVHQLDFALERIALSLKQITPDPLIEALESLESVVSDCKLLDGSVETVQADVEWTDVESLIKELQQIDGVDRVSKGRFFLSPGLAPTFQVYMSSMFNNQYKLLARSGNKVQELATKELHIPKQHKQGTACPVSRDNSNPWQGLESEEEETMDHMVIVQASLDKERMKAAILTCTNRVQ